MTDTSVVNPNDPIRMAPQGDVDAWRQSTPVPPPGGGADPLANQSPLAAMGAPPKPTAGPPPQQSLNMPPKPQMGAMQEGPKAPDAKDYEKNSMAFASAMAVLGAVAGRFTRMPGGAAMSAFAGALKGWQSGNLEQYEQAAKKWEQDTKTTLDNNRLVMEKYKLALEDRKMNIDEQMSQIQLTAAQYHDKMMYDAAQSKNYTMVAQIYEKNHEFTEKASEAASKLQEKRDEQKTKNEQSATYWLSPTGQAELAAVKPDGTPKYTMAQQAGVKQIIDIYGQKNVKPANEAFTRFMEENPTATAQEIQNFNAGAKPPRSAPAMAMRKFMDENPDATSDQIQQFQAKQAELSAAGRTKGGREANLDIILNVTDAAIPAALAASDKVPRGKWVPLNQIIQKGSVAQSDPATMQFGMANLQLAEGWARAMNPTGVMRESDRDKALSFLSTATSKETYKALVEQLRTQIQRERNAIQSGKQTTVSEPGGQSASASAPDFNDRFSSAGAGGGWGKAEVVQ
jgi:hypothetical protein